MPCLAFRNALRLKLKHFQNIFCYKTKAWKGNLLLFVKVNDLFYQSITLFSRLILPSHKLLIDKLCDQQIDQVIIQPYYNLPHHLLHKRIGATLQLSTAPKLEALLHQDQ